MSEPTSDAWRRFCDFAEWHTFLLGWIVLGYAVNDLLAHAVRQADAELTKMGPGR